jgi:outer membrane lipopolysaccharide assembly protein LptE/RlpB
MNSIHLHTLRLLSVRPAIRWLAGSVMVCGLVSGCGPYSASSGRVDENIKKVAVQFLENLTPEPNLGVELSEVIIFALQTDNTLKVVDEASADSIISGRVVRYARREMATTQDLTVNEYQVQIAVVLTFTVRSTGEQIFENRRFTGTGTYILNDPQGTSEDTARAEAVEEIVRDILAQVVEDW